MKKNYYLLKVLATAGAVWMVIVVLLYPKHIVEENPEIDALFESSNSDKLYRVRGVEEEKTERPTFAPVTNAEVADNTTKTVSSISLITKPAFVKPPSVLTEENPGEGGVGVKLPKSLPVDIEGLVRTGWKLHQFNLYVSDLISVNRTLKDHRPEFCNISAEGFSKNLPATSIIIIFHNEAWTTLLRSVHSVINQSPDELISEIILVDDFSDMDHLKQPLEEYMAQFPKVRILRAEKREGLIRARLRGALEAKGPTLTFLDSHIEAAPGWLEPLLDRIEKNPTTVVCPVIDMILDSTFEFIYPKTPLNIMIGGFSWKLTFKWDTIPLREQQRRSDPYEPIRSPTMAGGLFTIDKLYFEKLGMYDPDFDIWGAENLELSFKTWMCGGTLEIIPCSHVGHIYRRKSPYVWRPGVDVLKKNTIRLAEVWLDDYAKYFYMMTGYERSNFGDVTDRLKLRKNLNCKNFGWYMKNIYPEQFDPGDSLGQGTIKNMWNHSKACIAMGSFMNNQPIDLWVCSPKADNQFIFLTAKGELRKDSLCLDCTNPDRKVIGYYCHGNNGTQQWAYHPKSNQIVHVESSMCLSADPAKFQLIMENCSSDRVQQKWNFEYFSSFDS